MKQIMLFLLILVLTGFTISSNQKESWEQKYHEVKKERDYYQQTSVKLLKNWKECEEKKLELIK